LSFCGEMPIALIGFVAEIGAWLTTVLFTPWFAER
jgi:hypothetical protein